MAPVRLLELFFDNELVEMILTTLCCTVIKRKEALALKLLIKKLVYF